MQNRNDPWTNLTYVEKVFDEPQVEKEMYWVDLAPKRLAVYDHFNHHPEKMLEWFGRYLR